MDDRVEAIVRRLYRQQYGRASFNEGLAEDIRIAVRAGIELAAEHCYEGGCAECRHDIKLNLLKETP